MRASVCRARDEEWMYGAKVIVACSGAPRPYLVEVLLHTMAREGLVETKRGYRRGYRPRRRYRRITLFPRHQFP
jgi:DNA-binding IscR family transcriptional regulator